MPEPRVTQPRASTEPRLDGRGEAGVRAELRALRDASTEPRLDGRGEARGRWLELLDVLRFNGAATRWSRRWRGGCPRCTAETRFNGAATRWSRRGKAPKKGNGHQGGCCFNGAATRWSRRGLPWKKKGRQGRASFNGAATRWSRRGHAIHGPGGQGVRGFNGAATRWSRRDLVRTSDNVFIFLLLQRSRDSMVAESMRLAVAAGVRPPGFNGAATRWWRRGPG